MASSMEFWGVEVKAGVTKKVVPKDEMILHLSQACVANAKNGSEQALISVKVGDQKLVLGALSADKQPQMSFDLVFEKEFELSHTLKSGSVHFLGYQTFVPQDDEGFSDYDSSEDEDVPLDLTENGIIPNAAPAKPAPAKAIAAKPESSGKQKVKIEEPIKDDDDSDDDVFSDDSSDDDDISGESDSEMAEGDSEDDTDEEEEETPTPKKASKKRPNESASKTPVPAKKAKQATPQKTDGKNVHNATPHPAKKSGKTAEKGKPETPKSGGDLSCKSCSKTFGSDGALSSHNKAKHSAAK